MTWSQNLFHIEAPMLYGNAALANAVVSPFGRWSAIGRPSTI
jgi:hypothetical protein